MDDSVVGVGAISPSANGHGRTSLLAGTGVVSQNDQPSPLSASDIAHREAFRAYVLQDAAPRHRQVLGRLYALWDGWNAAHFDSRMVAPYILLAEPSTPSRYGDCGRVSSFGGRSQIRVRPSLLGDHPHMRPEAAYAEGRFLFVADVLLHEMIHQYHQEITGIDEESYHGHGPAFRDVCNAIGARLALPPVRDMKKRGADKALPSCAQWPHCVRPAAHYQGAYVPSSGDRRCGPLTGREWAELLGAGALLSEEARALLHMLAEYHRVTTAEKETA